MNSISSAISINSSTTLSASSTTTSITPFTQNKLTKKSGRTNLRCYHHNKNKTTRIQTPQQNLQHHILQIDSINNVYKSRIDNYCLGNFGFKPIVKQKIFQNVMKVIGEMMLKTYYLHNSNTKCHDLCTMKLLPSSMALLLSLGLKCCTQSKKIDMQALIATIKRFKYDVRVKHYVMTECVLKNYQHLCCVLNMYQTTCQEHLT